MRNAFRVLVCLGSLAAAQVRAADPTFEVVTSATDTPTFLADPNDGTGRLFITERAGRVRILSGGTKLQSPDDAFLDLHSVVDSTGEGGLHSMAFDPGFATNHFFYVEYTRTGSGGSPLETVIARYAVADSDPNHADPNSVHIVLTQPSPVGADFTNHKGGQLQFGPDGFLYFGFGDGGSGDDPGCRSQTRNVFFGKLLRLDVSDPNGDDFPADDAHNYKIPNSNPFRSDPNYAPEIWDLGLRNPYRFSFDRQTGQLWIADVGQNNREEIDLEPAFDHGGGGRNYGWKVWEGTRCNAAVVSTDTCPAYVSLCTDNQSPMGSYTPPLTDYDHTIGEAVIGGYVYRGVTQAWQGTYIFADLIGKIFALTPNGHGGFNSRKQIPAPVDAPISFGEDHTGELYVLAGSVYKIDFPPGVSFTKQQQACVRKLNAGFAALADARQAEIRTCVDRFASGKLTDTIDVCVDSTPSAKLDKLAARNTALQADQCTDPLPPFGLGGATAGNAAALDADEQTFFTDTLSEPPDDVVIHKATDKLGAACQKAVLKALASCVQARRGEFLRCKNAGLKQGSFADAAGLAGCLDQDPKARVQRACAPKLASVIQRSCTAKAVALSSAFPVCATEDPNALADCLDTSARCHTCELFDAADALGIDCATECGP
jgi:glucose/arabinose dehydrogenase